MEPDSLSYTPQVSAYETEHASVSTYIHVAQVPSIYTQCRCPVGRPESGSPVSRRGCEVDTHRTPFDIPHRILMPTVCDDVRHGIERPQTRRCVCGGRKKVFGRTPRAAGRIEGDGIHRPAVSDELAGCGTAFLSDFVD